MTKNSLVFMLMFLSQSVQSTTNWSTSGACFQDDLRKRRINVAGLRLGSSTAERERERVMKVSKLFQYCGCKFQTRSSLIYMLYGNIWQYISIVVPQLNSYIWHFQCRIVWVCLTIYWHVISTYGSTFQKRIRILAFFISFGKAL